MCVLIRFKNGKVSSYEFCVYAVKKSGYVWDQSMDAVNRCISFGSAFDDKGTPIFDLSDAALASR